MISGSSTQPSSGPYDRREQRGRGKGGAFCTESDRGGELHNTVTGKEFAGLMVSGRIGELGVQGGVLDIGMAQLVFDKGQIGAGFW